MQNEPNLPTVGNLPNMPGSKSKPPWLWPVLIVFILFIALIGGIYILLPKPSIEVPDQPLGKTVAVKKLVLTKGGYLLIRTSDRYNKPSNRHIAQADYLPADTYNDFTLDIFPQESDTNNPALKSGDLLFAILFEDLDNDFRLSSSDAIMKDWLQRQIIKSFRLK